MHGLMCYAQTIKQAPYTDQMSMQHWWNYDWQEN
jgi:hypothetical protein